MGVSMKTNLAFLVILLAALANQSGQRCMQLLDEDYFKCFLYGSLALCACVLSVLLVDVIRLNPANSHDFTSLTDQYFYQKRQTLYGRWIWKTMRLAIKSSQNAQKKYLLQVLNIKKVANKYDYGKIPNIEFFQDKIPFEDFEEHSNMIMNQKGQAAVMAELKHNKRRAASLMEYISSKNNKNRMGRPLVLIQGCFNNNKQPGHHLVEFIASTFRHHSFWCYPKEVFKIFDEETYLYLAAIHSLKEREVSYIIARDASTLYAFWNIVQSKWTEICDVIECGLIPEVKNVEEEDLYNLMETFRGHRTRARELRNEFKKGFKGIASRIWRKLSYVQTLNPESNSPEWYSLLNREMKDISLLKSCYYLANELIAIPDNINSNYYTPNTQTFYVEWIQDRDCEYDWPDVLTSDEVQTGKSYEMVLTSYDCEYIRCRTGLMVNMVTLVSGRPTFSFAQRSDYILNVEEEETRVDLLGEIIKGTTKRLGASLVNFAVTESVTDSFNIDSLRSYRLLYSGIGRVAYHYVLFIEVEKAKNKQQYDKSELLMFDKDLCLSFSQYQRARKLKKLSPMKVIEVEIGTFQKLRSIISMDKNTAPCNTPKILRTVKYLEFLLNNSKASFEWNKSGGRRY